MIRANLDVAVSMHSENCKKTAVFATVDHPGISNLLMTCEVGCFVFWLFVFMFYI